MSTTERYVSKSERSEAGITKALSWIKENVSATEYQSIDRSGVASSLGIALSSINRVILVLDQQGYLDAKRIGNSALYKVANVAKLSLVTPEETYAWIREYNQKCDEKVKQKKQSVRMGQGSELVTPIVEQNSGGANGAIPAIDLSNVFSGVRDLIHPDLSTFRATVYQMGPEDELTPAPLSPAQKLLAEALKLVEAEQNHKSEPEVLPEQLKGLETRLNRLENSTNIILYFFQQASTALRALPPAQLPVNVDQVATPLPDLEPTRRAKINRLVDGYAAAKTVSHQEVWKHLYGQLSSRFGFDAWQHSDGKKDPNYLDIIEKSGQLENLYSIAVESLTLSQR